MQIMPRSKRSRVIAGLLAGGACAALCVWIVKGLLADQFGRTPSIRNLQLAARLDPTNSVYHLKLSRLYEYSLADIDPNRAAEQAKRSIELNSYDPQAWLDLGATMEFEGKTSEAEACLRKADFLAPAIPQVQWGVGNFLLLHGNTVEAFRHFKVVLMGTTRYDQTLFDTAWKASADADEILRELIPENATTEFDYLSYLMDHQRYQEARNVWKRIMAGSQPFGAGAAAHYLQGLIDARRPDEAYGVWNDLRARGVIPPTYEQDRQNLVINGDFEQPLLNMGFDWAMGQSEAAYISVDPTTFHSPSHAILIQFSGKQNVAFQNLVQIVKVEPGRSYRLQGFLRTEGITTDSGPRLGVHDLYDPRALRKFSDDVKGDSTGWVSLLLDFKTPPKTRWIAVGVVRLPSEKLDNLIAGKVWVDDVSLSEPSEE
jgi:tetratricopeptide (TPR) repeat protein